MIEKKQSIIEWIDVNDNLPKLEMDVIVICKDGYVGPAMRQEMFIHERVPPLMHYARTNKTRIEWGISENEEYWHEIEGVIMWAEFPDATKLI